MSKKVYLLILWIVTLAAIVVGIWINVGGWFGLNIFKSTKTVTEDFTYGKSGIDTIELSMDAGAVKILEGEEFKVEYTYPEAYAPKVNRNGDKLEITQKVNKINSNHDDDNYHLTVYVPSNVELKLLDADLDLGELRISNINSKKLIADADCGSVRLNDVTAEKISLVANLGEIRLEGCVSDYVKADADMGDVYLEGDFNSVEADCDMGNIDITTKKSTDDVKFDVDCDLGNVTVNGKHWKN